jgi:hypothetical protein
VEPISRTENTQSAKTRIVTRKHFYASSQHKLALRYPGSPGSKRRNEQKNLINVSAGPNNKKVVECCSNDCGNMRFPEFQMSIKNIACVVNYEMNNAKTICDICYNDGSSVQILRFWTLSIVLSSFKMSSCFPFKT